MNSKIISYIKENKRKMGILLFWVWVVGYPIGMIFNINKEHSKTEQQILEHQRQIDEINNKVSDIYTEVQQISQFVATEQTEIEEESKEIETKQESVGTKTQREQTVAEETSRGGGRIMHVTCTAYTAGDGMTPGTVMANGETVHYGAIACNFLPIGTKVRIDGEIFTVKDRCGYGDRIDIYMNSLDECYQFGIRTKQVEVL